MNREELDTILNNADLDNGGKIDAILTARGKEMSDADARYAAMKAKYDKAVSDTAYHKDYDVVLQERDTLRAEKADREMSDRFTAVVGENKFKNTFTADGVRKLFSDALALPENEGKTDEDVYASISNGKEAEWYENPVKISMMPSAGRIETPTSFEAYLDEVYANNPFSKII